jgi:N-acetylmuramoyl-L-alanine amidase
MTRQLVVTAGHSDTDPGAIAPDGRTEAALARELRNIIASKLREQGVGVKTDGEWNQNHPLQVALRLIGLGPLAIELHFNASANPKARGVECISLPKHKAVSQHIAREISVALGSPLRGEQGWIDQSQSARGRLAFVNAGGIIVETCFISSPDELARYDGRRYVVASGIVRALLAHA